MMVPKCDFIKPLCIDFGVASHKIQLWLILPNRSQQNNKLWKVVHYSNFPNVRVDLSMIQKNPQKNRQNIPMVKSL